MTHPTLAHWIQSDTIPFGVNAPESFDTAVDTVVALLGDAVELLGFGEALHGGEAILMLRNRLFQRLVAVHGYSAIAVESSFPRARLVNDYVAGRGPESYDAVQETGFSHGFGQLEANRELVEWMRHYNADPAHDVALRFYGFDSPTEMMYADSPRTVLHRALDYLTALDSASADALRARIDPLLGADAAWENPAAAMDPSQGIGLSPDATQLRIETEELISELRVRRPELIARSDRDRHAEAVHYATIARQLLTYHAGVARELPNRVARLLGLRDAAMADNLAYIKRRERGRGKVFVFAHNSHLKCGKTEWQLGPMLNVWWAAGAHLAAMFGPRYAVIGSALGVSEANGIGQPEVDTLEARLTAMPGPARFIPTYKGLGLPAAEIAALPVRSSSTKNSTYFALTPQSLTDFNWLAVLDSSGYSRGGPPLVPPDAGAG